MDRTDVRNDADVWSRHLRKERNLATAVHRHFEDRALVIGSQPQEREGDTDIRVVVGFALEHPVVSAQY